MVAKTVSQRDYPPFTILNIVIALAAMATVLYCLYAASHAEAWWQVLLWVALFSYVNNTLFSLLHEAVHFSFSKNKFINEMFGVICASFFPTGLYYQRVCHLGHHARNRTDDEMFDLYYPDDNRFLKRLQLYCILTPMYWASIVFGNLMYLFCPWFYDFSKYMRSKVKWWDRTGAKMLDPFSRHPMWRRIRGEIFYTFLFQATIIYALDLSLTGWLLCYLAFGMNWCSVQYADHAWSDRDIVHGAWNLKVNKVVQFIFLNYHHHAVHHQYPNLPWVHLHKFVDWDGPRPSFLKIYIELWKGPKPTASGDPKPVSKDFLELLWNKKTEAKRAVDHG